jgi:Glycosyl transferase family group 2
VYFNRCVIPSLCFVLIINVPLQPVLMAKLLLSWVTMRITLSKLLSNYHSPILPSRFLRWKAIQDAVFVDPTDGKQKIWSESNVSEDFDMALRLILKGYIVRCVSLSHILSMLRFAPSILPIHPCTTTHLHPNSPQRLIPFVDFVLILNFKPLILA